MSLQQGIHEFAPDGGWIYSCFVQLFFSFLCFLQTRDDIYIFHAFPPSFEERSCPELVTPPKNQENGQIDIGGDEICYSPIPGDEDCIPVGQGDQGDDEQGVVDQIGHEDASVGQSVE